LFCLFFFKEDLAKIWHNQVTEQCTELSNRAKDTINFITKNLINESTAKVKSYITEYIDLLKKDHQTARKSESVRKSQLDQAMQLSKTIQQVEKMTFEFKQSGKNSHSSFTSS
jgi:ATP-dependent Zn protease